MNIKDMNLSSKHLELIKNDVAQYCISVLNNFRTESYISNSSATLDTQDIKDLVACRKTEFYRNILAETELTDTEIIYDLSFKGSYYAFLTTNITMYNTLFSKFYRQLYPKFSPQTFLVTYLDLGNRKLQTLVNVEDNFTMYRWMVYNGTEFEWHEFRNDFIEYFNALYPIGTVYQSFENVKPVLGWWTDDILAGYSIEGAESSSRVGTPESLGIEQGVRNFEVNSSMIAQHRHKYLARFGGFWNGSDTFYYGDRSIPTNMRTTEKLGVRLYKDVLDSGAHATGITSDTLFPPSSATIESAIVNSMCRHSIIYRWHRYE